MDVILTEVENGKSKFIFPSLPEEVKGNKPDQLSVLRYSVLWRGKNPERDEAYRDFIRRDFFWICEKE